MGDLRVCFLGDSYTAGVGDSESLGWVGRVCALARGRGHDLTAYNLGVRGDTGGQIASRAEREIDARLRLGDRKAVVLAFGANDLRHERPTTESIAALDAVLMLAAMRGLTAFVVSPPVYEGDADPRAAVLGEAMMRHCAGLDTAFFDLRAAQIDWPRWWREAHEGDGAHPGAASYTAWARAFDDWAPWRGWLDEAG